MEKIKELAELFLQEAVLEYFQIVRKCFQSATEFDSKRVQQQILVPEKKYLNFSEMKKYANGEDNILHS